MSFLLGATCVVGIIFMSVLMFVGIWLFIIALKSFHQLQYKNYILEKMYQKLDLLARDDILTNNHKEDLITKDFMDAFDLDNEENPSNLENIKDF